MPKVHGHTEAPPFGNEKPAIQSAAIGKKRPVFRFAPFALVDFVLVQSYVLVQVVTIVNLGFLEAFPPKRFKQYGSHSG
jgi:hypothetical protein